METKKEYSWLGKSIDGIREQLDKSNELKEGILKEMQESNRLRKLDLAYKVKNGK